MVTEPGDWWNYNGGTTAIIGRLIAQGTDMPIDAYAQQKLFGPLGINDLDWIKGSDGVPSAASGLRLNIHGLAKIGRMVLGKGDWEGCQTVPRDWLMLSSTPHANLQDGICYGLFWWLAPDGTPPNWVAGFGNGGQRLMISPRSELIVCVFWPCIALWSRDCFCRLKHARTTMTSNRAWMPLSLRANCPACIAF